MTTGDFDGTAETLYRFAGFATTEQAPIVVLAERLLGDGAVRTAPRGILKTHGAIARVGANWRVYVAADCPNSRRGFVLAHELAHWALGAGANEEACDRLAGALLLPRAAYLNAQASTRAMAVVAARFGTDETCCWLRFGEATGAPLALVTPQAVRVRGAAYSWPPAPELRRLVDLPRAPGLRRARLRDAPGRAVLRAC